MRATSAGRPHAAAPEILQRLNNYLSIHYLDTIVGKGKKANISKACVVCFTRERKLMSLQGMAKEGLINQKKKNSKNILCTLKQGFHYSAAHDFFI